MPQLEAVKDVTQNPSDNEYPRNCRICHQEQTTTKSRTLAKLYRCKRRAKGEIVSRQTWVWTTVVSWGQLSMAKFKSNCSKGHNDRAEVSLSPSRVSVLELRKFAKTRFEFRPSNAPVENILDNNECHNRNWSEASELLVVCWENKIKHALHQYKDI